MLHPDTSFCGCCGSFHRGGAVKIHQEWAGAHWRDHPRAGRYAGTPGWSLRTVVVVVVSQSRGRSRLSLPAREPREGWKASSRTTKAGSRSISYHNYTISHQTERWDSVWYEKILYSLLGQLRKKGSLLPPAEFVSVFHIFFFQFCFPSELSSASSTDSVWSGDCKACEEQGHACLSGPYFKELK